MVTHSQIPAFGWLIYYIGNEEFFLLNPTQCEKIIMCRQNKKTWKNIMFFTQCFAALNRTEFYHCFNHSVLLMENRSNSMMGGFWFKSDGRSRSVVLMLRKEGHCGNLLLIYTLWDWGRTWGWRLSYRN